MATSRRHFLTTTGAGFAGDLLAQSVPVQASVNDKIQIALIGNGKPVLEDAVFGFRAAGPALLSDTSYFEQRVCVWDPDAMVMK